MSIVLQVTDKVLRVSLDPASGVVRSIEAEITEVGVDSESGEQMFAPRKRFEPVADIAALQAIIGQGATEALVETRNLSELVLALQGRVTLQGEALDAASQALDAVAAADSAWDEAVRARVAAAQAQVASAQTPS